jgi:hypothetical protein
MFSCVQRCVYRFAGKFYLHLQVNVTEARTQYVMKVDYEISGHSHEVCVSDMFP